MANRRREALSVRSDVVNADRATPSQVLGVVIEKISGPYRGCGGEKRQALVGCRGCANSLCVHSGAEGGDCEL